MIPTRQEVPGKKGTFQTPQKSLILPGQFSSPDQTRTFVLESANPNSLPGEFPALLI